MKQKTLRFIIIFILSGLAFFALTVPFHKILSVFSLSEVRPSAVLYPFLSISFGLPSILGIACANLISDAVNGYSVAVLIEGIIPQMLYSFVPYIVWKKLNKGEEHIHRLDSVSRVLKFALVCFLFAILSGIGTGIIINTNFGAPFSSVFFFVFLNNFDVSIILGYPLMIISNQIISRRSGTDRTLTINEKIVLAANAIEIIGLLVLTVIMYNNNATLGSYDIWNSIYLCSIVLINCILLLTLLVMVFLKKNSVK